MQGKSLKALKDWVKIRLPGTKILFRRSYSAPKAHEITIVIPRVEMKYNFKFGRLQFTREVILNSITIVDAPRHPPGGETARNSTCLTDKGSGFPVKITYS